MSGRAGADALVIAALAAALALAGAAPAASRTCRIAGATRVASSGALVVITTPDRSIEACIGARPNFQLETLNNIDGPCTLRKVSATLGRYVGIDIRCTTDLDISPEELVSYDVRRRSVRYGSEEAGLDDVRPGVVFAPGGAFAYIEDFGAKAEVIACDARTRCLGASATPNRVLDRSAKATIGGLAIHGSTVLWHNGAARRHAKLATPGGRDS